MAQNAEQAQVVILLEFVTFPRLDSAELGALVQLGALAVYQVAVVHLALEMSFGVNGPRGDLASDY